MKSITARCRLCLFLVVTVVSAVAAGYGCHHKNLGSLDPTKVPSGWGESGPDTRTVTASLGSLGIHNINIDFGSPMRTATVTITVTDEQGNEIPFVNSVWRVDKKSIRLNGPFIFCESYYVTISTGAQDIDGVTLQDDLMLIAETGRNPYDVDAGGSCTADVAISPLFTDGPDGALFTGDFISGQRSFGPWHKSDIDTEDIFYVDYSQQYDGAEAMVRLPGMATNGAAAVAQIFREDEYDVNNVLVTKHYTVNVWDANDAQNDIPTSAIIFDIAGSSSKTLRGPYYAGDIRGDGNGGMNLSTEYPYGSGTVLQETRIVTGPIPYGDNPLTDLADSWTVVGALGDIVTPLRSAGDVNIDGKDDLVALRHEIYPVTGKPINYEVWVFKGNDVIDNVFRSTSIDKISGYPGRSIVDVDAADVNGDGKSDILITELQSKYHQGAYLNVKPRVGIFFGRPSLDELSMIDAAPVLFFNTTDETIASVSALGDINGDGFDDIAIFVEEEDVYHKVVSSKVYVIQGRKNWYDAYYVNFPADPKGNPTINVKDYGEISIDNAMTGDIDNDGYYDFMITADYGTGKTAYFFFGKNGYSNDKWILDLDDADIKMNFGM